MSVEKRSDVGGQRSEGGEKRSDVGGQREKRSEVGRWRKNRMNGMDLG